MNMLDTNTLVEFCIAQHGAFAAQDWIQRREADAEAVAFAAKYLSMTSWYGHEDELDRIAACVYSSAGSSVGLHREVRNIGFDLTAFSTGVRSGISAPKGSSPRRE